MNSKLSQARFLRSMTAMVVMALAVTAPAFLQAQDPPAKAAPATPAPADPVVNQLVEAHNKERAKEKLPPLKLEAKLTEAAKVHAQDMADHEVMTHDGSDGSSPHQRVADAGYHYRLTGENVARGYRNVKEVMQSWMESPPHKKNVLGDYSEIGVSRIFGDDGKAYWCIEFGKPMPKFEPATAAADLAKRLNDERATAKHVALTVDSRLTKAAQDQASKLAKEKSKGGGTATFEGIDPKLFQDSAVSTASGHPDAEAMTKVLMANPDLKDQILGKYSRIGTGYATSEDGIPYWCLILANPVRGRTVGKAKLNNQ